MLHRHQNTAFKNCHFMFIGTFICNKLNFRLFFSKYCESIDFCSHSLQTVRLCRIDFLTPELATRWRFSSRKERTCPLLSRVMFCWVGYFKGCLHRVGELSWIPSMVAAVSVEQFVLIHFGPVTPEPVEVFHCVQNQTVPCGGNTVYQTNWVQSFGVAHFWLGAVHKVGVAFVILFPVQIWSHFASTVPRSFQSYFSIPTHCPGNSQRMSSGLFRLFSPHVLPIRQRPSCGSGSICLVALHVFPNQV